MYVVQVAIHENIILSNYACYKTLLMGKLIIISKDIQIHHFTYIKETCYYLKLKV